MENSGDGLIRSDKYYVWDNWGFMNKAGTLHIYAQYCDKDKCKVPEDRYWNVRIEHFSSDDNGKTFIHRGTAIDISTDKNAPDSYNIWSGSTFPIDEKKVFGFYTGLKLAQKSLPNERKFAQQSICLAVSHDGGNNFEKLNEPLISPIRDYDKLREMGYYLGSKDTLGAIDDPDGTFMCLRDPEIYQENGVLHMIFGAKAEQNGELRNAVGHTIIRDTKNPQNIDIQKPLFIANEKDYNQLELPGLVKKDERYLLIISTTKLDYIGQADTDVEKTVRIYTSSKLEDGDWQPFGRDGKHKILDSKKDGLYGPKLIHENSNGKVLRMRPFVVGETFAPPTMGVEIELFSAKTIKELSNDREMV